jgi:hypothetical protein
MRAAQVTRAALGSLMDAYFAPLVSRAQSADNPKYSKGVAAGEVRAYKRLVLTGLALTKFLSFWSTVSDIAFSLSQIDLALTLMVAGTATAVLTTEAKIDGVSAVRVRMIEPSPPKGASEGEGGEADAGGPRRRQHGGECELKL